MQKLEDQPSIETRDLHPGADGLRPRDTGCGAAAGLGVGRNRACPFSTPACAICAATGWLNFRMRAMVMSVASYHLWLDWRATGPASGADVHRLRAGHPLAAGADAVGHHRDQHAPHLQPGEAGAWSRTRPARSPGAGCRNWPTVPDAFLQEPWKWPERARLLGRRYPEPVVDVAAAARAARDTHLAACARGRALPPKRSGRAPPRQPGRRDRAVRERPRAVRRRLCRRPR